ncbi:hypothetical protein JOE65_002864 [Arthrobacter roseus]|nr:hypothetical protein [Arthrobacter roseus]
MRQPYISFTVISFTAEGAPGNVRTTPYRNRPECDESNLSSVKRATREASAACYRFPGASVPLTWSAGGAQK